MIASTFFTETLLATALPRIAGGGVSRQIAAIRDEEIRRRRAAGGFGCGRTARSLASLPKGERADAGAGGGEVADRGEGPWLHRQGGRHGRFLRPFQRSRQRLLRSQGGGQGGIRSRRRLVEAAGQERRQIRRGAAVRSL